jgi:hypothetical protein
MRRHNLILRSYDREAGDANNGWYRIPRDAFAEDRSTCSIAISHVAIGAPTNTPYDSAIAELRFYGLNPVMQGADNQNGLSLGIANLSATAQTSSYDTHFSDVTIANPNNAYINMQVFDPISNILFVDANDADISEIVVYLSIVFNGEDKGVHV